MIHGSALAAMAIVSMVAGPLPQEQNVLTAQMCGGGEITIPLGEEEPAKGRDCHQQACHAGTCREKPKKPV